MQAGLCESACECPIWWLVDQTVTKSDSSTLQVPQGRHSSPGGPAHLPTPLPSPPVPQQHYQSGSQGPTTSIITSCQVNPLPLPFPPAWAALASMSQASTGPSPASSLPLLPSYPQAAASAASSAAPSGRPSSTSRSPQSQPQALRQHALPDLPGPFVPMDTDTPSLPAPEVQPDWGYPPLPQGVTPAQAALMHSWWQQMVSLLWVPGSHTQCLQPRLSLACATSLSLSLSLSLPG